MHYTGPAILNAEFRNGIFGNFSLGQDNSDLTWGVSASGYFQADCFKRYRAFDSDADTFSDTIMDENTYQITELGNTDYDESNKTIYYSAAVNGFAKIELEDSNAVILNFSWVPLDIESTTSYTRTIATDVSQNKDTINESLLQGDIYAAYDMKLGKKSSMRIGAGVEVLGTRRLNNNLDIAGVTTDDPLNTDRYTEQNWGADPANGAVIAAVGTADSEFELEIPLSIEFRFKPAETVTLFSGLNGSFVHRSMTYNVFNTADNSIWTEKTSFTSFDISTLELVGGIDFMINDSIALLMVTRVSPFSTGFTFSGDPMPESGGVDTTDVSNDLSTYTDFDFNFNLTVTFRY